MAKKDKDIDQSVADAAEKKPKEAKKTKSSAKKANGKPGVWKRIKNWFHDLRVEFRKVIWPDKKTVRNQTTVVLSVIVLFSLFIGLLDEGLLKLMELLIKLGQ